MWQEGLLSKIKQNFSLSFYQLLKYYLEDKSFFVKVQDSYSKAFNIEAGVTQGSVLGSTLYALFTADIPTTHDTIIFTFANDLAVLATHKDPISVYLSPQQHIVKIERCLELWKIKVNADKCKYITFTLRKGTVPPVTLTLSPRSACDKM